MKSKIEKYTKFIFPDSELSQRDVDTVAPTAVIDEYSLRVRRGDSVFNVAQRCHRKHMGKQFSPLGIATALTRQISTDMLHSAEMEETL